MTDYDYWLQNEPEPEENIEDLRDTEEYDVVVDDKLTEGSDTND